MYLFRVSHISKGWLRVRLIHICRKAFCPSDDFCCVKAQVFAHQSFEIMLSLVRHRTGAGFRIANDMKMRLFLLLKCSSGDQDGYTAHYRLSRRPTSGRPLPCR
jgi:hypothetical protein